MAPRLPVPHQRIEVIFVDDSDDDAGCDPAIESDLDVRLIHRDARPAGRWARRRGRRGHARCPRGLGLRDGRRPPAPAGAPRAAPAGGRSSAPRTSSSRAVSARGRHRELQPCAHVAVARRASSAAAAVPRRLRKVTDPLSGYFLVRRDAVGPGRLEPQGFKILLEILVRTPGLRVSEVPFEFGERYAGETKASVREAMRFVSASSSACASASSPPLRPLRRRRCHRSRGQHAPVRRAVADFAACTDRRRDPRHAGLDPLELLPHRAVGLP